MALIPALECSRRGSGANRELHSLLHLLQAASDPDLPLLVRHSQPNGGLALISPRPGPPRYKTAHPCMSDEITFLATHWRCEKDVNIMGSLRTFLGRNERKKRYDVLKLHPVEFVAHDIGSR